MVLVATQNKYKTQEKQGVEIQDYKTISTHGNYIRCSSFKTLLWIIGCGKNKGWEKWFGFNVKGWIGLKWNGWDQKE